MSLYRDDRNLSLLPANFKGVWEHFFVPLLAPEWSRVEQDGRFWCYALKDTPYTAHDFQAFVYSAFDFDKSGEDIDVEEVEPGVYHMVLPPEED